jgi:glycosyltransferase involved in cell wall biosynthesis
VKLLFVTFAPLDSGAGHLARFVSELSFLAALCDVSVVSLGKEPDGPETRRKYGNVSFCHVKAKFDGWDVTSLPEVIEAVSDIVDEARPDMVVLLMEVWDVMRGLGQALQGCVRFATVTHAMPFLGAPFEPSGDFARDVTAYAASGIESHRREYILAHYREADRVFGDMTVIANNKTVGCYLKTYFPGLKLRTMADALVGAGAIQARRADDLKYDFTYMARMEAGKGVEYLAEILRRVASIAGRQVSVAVMGRTDDNASRRALEDLVHSAKEEGFAKIDVLGWADGKLKDAILSETGVFIYPSRYDNYPTVVNEALSHGLPVVTWDVPFYRCCYRGTQAVTAVPPFDCGLFAEAALNALKNRESLSKVALEYAKSFGSVEDCARSDFQLFSDVANDKPQGSI